MPYVQICSALILAIVVLGIGGCELENHRNQTQVSKKSAIKSLNREISVPEGKISRLSERKQRFIQTLLPLIKKENKLILGTRTSLKLMTRKASLITSDHIFIKKLARDYRVKNDDLSHQQLVQKLLHRVDVLPADLVLAQAAMETAWGSSRFAKQANNYFGQWCFTRGCGLVPAEREEGKRHEVRRFVNPAESVSAYMKNINSHPSYQALRDVRYKYRERKEIVAGDELAEGLVSYSQIGTKYVLAIRDIIKSNGLRQLTVAI